MPNSFNILKNETLVFLDLETTGLKFDLDKIIEIGAVKVKNGKILERFHELINPRISVPFFITQLTKIKQEDLLDKPAVEEIKEQLFLFLDKHPIVCHNASFEMGFLSAVKGERLENVFFDTCELSLLLYPLLENYKLENLLKIFKIKDTEAHRALIDAEDTFKLWQSLFLSLDTNDLNRIQALNRLLSRSNLPLKRIFADLIKFLKRRLKNKGEDDKSCSLSSQSKTEDNRLLSTASEKQQIDKKKLREIFNNVELFSQVFKNYEVREEQILMSECVAEVLNESKYLAIEAGTGVGKSLGYLMPCVLFSVNNKEKIVVSTNTKNLQDQLVQKDIPLTKLILKTGFTATVIKGRDNYLCLRKLKGLLKDLQNFDDEGKLALAYLVSFRYESPEGQLAKISPYLLHKNKYLVEFADYLASELPFCLKDRCPHFEDCFYQMTIKRAQKADILIANHSLIFSQPYWMPAYSYLVLDEAHNVEDAATRAFTETISLKDMRSLLDNLTDKGARRGLCFVLKRKNYPLGGQLGILKKRVLDAKTLLEDFSKRVFSIRDLCQKMPKTKLMTVKMEDVEKEPVFAVTEETHSRLINALKKVIESLFLISHCKTLDFEDRLKISGFAEKAEAAVRIFKELISADSRKKVRWLEISRVDEKNRKPSFSWKFFSSPLEVASILAGSVFANLKTAVLTSATLKVGGSFSFFSERIGLGLLDKKRLLFKEIGSPFDFRKNSILGIPKDFPSYNHENDQKYLDALSRGIEKIVLDIRGKNLALFSSRQRMEKVYAAVKEVLEKEGVLTLCQGLDGSRYFLIKQLRQTGQDMLVFGSKSFQEGVDVSGLSCVFIDKLPFPHRHDPIVSARRQHLIEQGRNAFREYELPQAVIALRQGFGRLIRKRSDWGLVVIFDNRLLGKDYREFIIKSLPQSQIVPFTQDEFLDLREKFISLRNRNF